MQRAARGVLLGLVGVLAATGCGDAFGIDDVLGTWETTSVNGDPVPGVVQVNGSTVDIQYERWTFMDGGECTVVGQYDGDVSSVDRSDCDYTVNLEQETLVVTLFDAFDIQGSVDGSRMTLNEDDIVIVLRKQ